MANDISYFKVEGDETQYSFNDADLEARIGATALPTTAQTVTGAIAEHEGDISTLNSKVNGTAIPSGANLNNYTTVGRYYIASSDIASSLSNKPSDLSASSSMEVLNHGAGINQIIYQIGATTENIYARAYRNSSWATWHKISSAEIASINSNLNGFTLTRSSIPASGSKAISMSASSSYMIVLTGSGVNMEHSIITVIQNASGATPLYKEVVLGSAITISATADKLTISNGASSHTVYVAILTLRGSPPTV